MCRRATSPLQRSKQMQSLRLHVWIRMWWLYHVISVILCGMYLTLMVLVLCALWQVWQAVFYPVTLTFSKP